MANAAALIRETLWKDRDFRAVPRLAQTTYMQLLSQKDLDCAGMLTLHLELLAKGCQELTVKQLRQDLEHLEAARFAYVDEEYDEVLIRSYARQVSAKSPNAWKAVFKAARLIQSPKLRQVLAAELRRIHRKDADDLAQELHPLQTPSEPPPNPIANPSEGDNPSEWDPEPPRSVLVVDTVTLSTTQVGEGPPKCPDHETNSNEPCGPCRARRRWEEYQAALADAEAENERKRQRLLLEQCTLCDDRGLIEVDEDTQMRCDHRPVAVA